MSSVIMSYSSELGGGSQTEYSALSMIPNWSKGDYDSEFIHIIRYQLQRLLNIFGA